MRGELAEYPRNPLLWSDLSRLYTSVNSKDKATRSMQVALSLARNDRFVLRGASRLFLHQGEKEKAHKLLESAETLKADPWILAAEIATASAYNKTSKYIKP